MYSLSGNAIFRGLSICWQPVFTSAALASLHLIKKEYLQEETEGIEADGHR